MGVKNNETKKYQLTCHLNGQQRDKVHELQLYWIGKKQKKVTVKQAVVYSLEVAYKVLRPVRKQNYGNGKR